MDGVKLTQQALILKWDSFSKTNVVAVRCDLPFWCLLISIFKNSKDVEAIAFRPDW